jgi:magnesium and cobalt transporter
MAGIVCLENIIEEIVGEIQDEYDHEEEEIKKVSPVAYICDARTIIADLNETLGISISSEGTETVGGYVFNLFGKVPNEQDRIIRDGIEFKIERMEGRRIKKIWVNLSGLESTKNSNGHQ